MTRPTLAELRAEFLDDICHVCGRVGHVGCATAVDLDAIISAARAEEREACAAEDDALADESDMAAYACLGGATVDTEPGEVLDSDGLSIAAATSCAHRAGAARIRALGNP